MTSDPLGLRAHAPLLDAYLRVSESAPTPFTIPGHKQRTDLVGDVIRGDIPLYGGLDTMKVDHGTLAAAERLAADAWGADWLRFSVGGSTHGNQALALAVGAPGGEVVVGRTLHRSLLLGLVLADLIPVWVHPRIDDTTGLPLGYDAATIDSALTAHPNARAVFLGDPSYIGTFADLAAIADTTHARDIPLIVDAAWGAHFGFHPALPPHALAAGADAMVTSAHKMLPAYSAAALVMADTRRFDTAPLESAFEATHTTSPPGSILASIDAVRALLQHHGRELLDSTIAIVTDARDRLAAVAGLIVLGPDHAQPTQLTVSVAGAGVNGNDIERGLICAGMPIEYADRDTLAPIITIGDTEQTVDLLVTAMIDLIETHRGEPRGAQAAVSWSVRPDQVATPREAFFAAHTTVPAHDAIGRVSAELIAPYPPGVPVLAPGERITAEIVDALRAAQAQGTRIAYAADPTLTTLRVLA